MGMDESCLPSGKHDYRREHWPTSGNMGDRVRISRARDLASRVWLYPPYARGRGRHAVRGVEISKGKPPLTLKAVSGVCGILRTYVQELVYTEEMAYWQPGRRRRDWRLCRRVVLRCAPGIGSPRFPNQSAGHDLFVEFQGRVLRQRDAYAAGARGRSEDYR